MNANAANVSALRIGSGFDVHAFAKNRPLIIGGVTIPHPRGLAGHSDADVLTHAVCDAALGALALGDIGAHFPDHDPAYKDADSIALLARVANLLRQHGARIINVDSTVALQTPKLAPHIAAMRHNLAAALGVDVQRVSIKATTTEKLGFVGRQEGAAAFATALVQITDPSAS